MSDCNKLKDLIGLYCDGEVTKQEKELVEKHISKCKQCRQKLEVMLKAKEILSNSQAMPVPENLFSDFVKYKETAEKQEKKVVPFYKNYRMYASLAAVFIFAFVLKSGLLEQDKFVSEPITQGTYQNQTLTAPPEDDLLNSDVQETTSVEAQKKQKAVSNPVAKNVLPSEETPATVAETPSDDAAGIVAFSDEETTTQQSSGDAIENSRMIQPPEDVNIEISDVKDEAETQAKIYVLPQYEKRASELLGDSLYLLYQAEQKLIENEIPFESNFLLLDETIPYNIIINVINE